MTRSIRSAWVALRRPAVLLSTLVAVAAFAALATVLTLTSAGDASVGGPGPGLQGVTKAALAQADGLVAGLANATTFLGVVAVVVGASAVASDFQHGTLRALLVRQPDRIRLLAGKLVAVIGLLTLAAVVAAVASVATALAVAGPADVDSSAWSVGQAAAATLRTAVAMAGFGLLGGVLGAVLRSSVAAIGIGVAWLLTVELLLDQAWGAADTVLPGQLLSAIADGSVGAGQLAAATLWTLAALALAAVLTQRRDVTA